MSAGWQRTCTAVFSVVSVTRNGRQQELVLNIAQVAAEAEQMGTGMDGNVPMEPPPPPEQDPGSE